MGIGRRKTDNSWLNQYIHDLVADPLNQELSSRLENCRIDPKLVDNLSKLTTLCAQLKQTSEDALFREDELQAALDRQVSQLRESKDRLQLAIESGQIGIWDWHVAQDKLIWNAEQHRMFDRPIENFRYSYSDFIHCVHPDDQARINQVVESVLASGAPYDTTYRIIWRDGTIRTIHAKAKIYLEEEKIIRVTGVCIDLTHSQELEAETV